ncbi:hypothetical protein D3C80_1370660 [compost metagenome]
MPHPATRGSALARAAGDVAQVREVRWPVWKTAPRRTVRAGPIPLAAQPVAGVRVARRPSADLPAGSAAHGHPPPSRPAQAAAAVRQRGRSARRAMRRRLAPSLAASAPDGVASARAVRRWSEGSPGCGWHRCSGAALHGARPHCAGLLPALPGPVAGSAAASTAGRSLRAAAPPAAVRTAQRGYPPRPGRRPGQSRPGLQWSGAGTAAGR